MIPSDPKIKKKGMYRYILVLEMRKIRHRDVWWFLLSHRASLYKEKYGSRSQGDNSGCSGMTRPVPLNKEGFSGDLKPLLRKSPLSFPIGSRGRDLSRAWVF